jgi:hypothetical protein
LSSLAKPIFGKSELLSIIAASPNPDPLNVTLHRLYCCSSSSSYSKLIIGVSWNRAPASASSSNLMISMPV